MRSFIVIILLLVSNCIYCQTVNPVTGKVWMDTCLSGYYQWGKSSNQFQLVNNPSNFLSLNHDPCPVGWRLPLRLTVKSPVPSVGTIQGKLEVLLAIGTIRSDGS